MGWMSVTSQVCRQIVVSQTDCPQAIPLNTQGELELGNLRFTSWPAGHIGGTVNLCPLTDVGRTWSEQQFAELLWKIALYYIHIPLSDQGGTCAIINAVPELIPLNSRKVNAKA